MKTKKTDAKPNFPFQHFFPWRFCSVPDFSNCRNSLGYLRRIPSVVGDARVVTIEQNKLNKRRGDV